MITIFLVLASLNGGPQASDAALEAPAPLDVRLHDDPKRRYFVHRPPEEVAAPKKGFRLMLVLPGGSGSADFAPFVGRIREHALGDSWVVAQVVAPVWSEDQADRNVWPTRRNPWSGMERSSEELVHEVLADVRRRVPVDPDQVFTLAWSSSGTLAYTLALEPKSGIRGAIVAMSVYKPDLLPSLRGARRKPFYLLHSPEDFIPIAMAESARDELDKKGAHVELRTYAGGHGWHGDVYGLLRDAAAFLERKSG